ncbi:hypothetical protein ACN9M1_21885 [Ralstonia sp. R-29]|uniref:hypothetical protein n=1 Tax=Ralstonia sp. R-29 TaxID=3404059 RepID=UPI003CEC3D92
MAIRFQRVLPLAALAALLATGTAVAAQSVTVPQAKNSARDPYTDGARIGARDAYTDGARSGARDPYTDGAARAALEARAGTRDPYTDGGLISPRGRDPYTDGANA